MFYTIVFSSLIANRTRYVKPIVHAYNSYPFTSYIHAPLSTSRDMTAFVVESQRVENHRLPHPYPTDCRDYVMTSRNELMAECIINATIEQLGLLAFSELKVASKYGSTFGDLRISHPMDLIENETLAIGMEKIRSECNEKHAKMDCVDQFYISRITSRQKWGNDEQLAFRVLQPNHPSILTVYQPMEDFYTFALLLLSCFGVWLGLSLADLNPFKLFKRFNQITRKASRLSRVATAS